MKSRQGDLSAKTSLRSKPHNLPTTRVSRQSSKQKNTTIPRIRPATSAKSSIMSTLDPYTQSNRGLTTSSRTKIPISSPMPSSSRNIPLQFTFMRDMSSAEKKKAKAQAKKRILNEARREETRDQLYHQSRLSPSASPGEPLTDIHGNLEETELSTSMPLGTFGQNPVRPDNPDHFYSVHVKKDLRSDLTGMDKLQLERSRHFVVDRYGGNSHTVVPPTVEHINTTVNDHDYFNQENNNNNNENDDNNIDYTNNSNMLSSKYHIHNESYLDIKQSPSHLSFKMNIVDPYHDQQFNNALLPFDIDTSNTLEMRKDLRLEMQNRTHKITDFFYAIPRKHRNTVDWVAVLNYLSGINDHKQLYIFLDNYLTQVCGLPPIARDSFSQYRAEHYFTSSNNDTDTRTSTNTSYDQYMTLKKLFNEHGITDINNKTFKFSISLDNQHYINTLGYNDDGISNDMKLKQLHPSLHYNLQYADHNLDSEYYKDLLRYDEQQAYTRALFDTDNKKKNISSSSLPYGKYDYDGEDDNNNDPNMNALQSIQRPQHNTLSTHHNTSQHDQLDDLRKLQQDLQSFASSTPSNDISQQQDSLIKHDPSVSSTLLSTSELHPKSVLDRNPQGKAYSRNVQKRLEDREKYGSIVDALRNADDDDISSSSKYNKTLLADALSTGVKITIEDDGTTSYKTTTTTPNKDDNIIEYDIDNGHDDDSIPTMKQKKKINDNDADTTTDGNNTERIVSVAHRKAIEAQLDITSIQRTMFNTYTLENIFDCLTSPDCISLYPTRAYDFLQYSIHHKFNLSHQCFDTVLRGLTSHDNTLQLADVLLETMFKLGIQPSPYTWTHVLRSYYNRITQISYGLIQTALYKSICNIWSILLSSHALTLDSAYIMSTIAIKCLDYKMLENIVQECHNRMLPLSPAFLGFRILSHVGILNTPLSWSKYTSMHTPNTGYQIIDGLVHDITTPITALGFSYRYSYMNKLSPQTRSSLLMNLYTNYMKNNPQAFSASSSFASAGNTPSLPSNVVSPVDYKIHNTQRSFIEYNQRMINIHHNIIHTSLSHCNLSFLTPELSLSLLHAFRHTPVVDLHQLDYTEHIKYNIKPYISPYNPLYDSNYSEYKIFPRNHNGTLTTLLLSLPTLFDSTLLAPDVIKASHINLMTDSMYHTVGLPTTLVHPKLYSIARECIESTQDYTIDYYNNISRLFDTSNNTSTSPTSSTTSSSSSSSKPQSKFPLDPSLQLKLPLAHLVPDSLTMLQNTEILKRPSIQSDTINEINISYQESLLSLSNLITQIGHIVHNNYTNTYALVPPQQHTRGIISRRNAYNNDIQQQQQQYNQQQQQQNNNNSSNAGPAYLRSKTTISKDNNANSNTNTLASTSNKDHRMITHQNTQQNKIQQYTEQSPNNKYNPYIEPSIENISYNDITIPSITPELQTPQCDILPYYKLESSIYQSNVTHPSKYIHCPQYIKPPSSIGKEFNSFIKPEDLDDVTFNYNLDERGMTLLSSYAICLRVPPSQRENWISGVLQKINKVALRQLKHIDGYKSGDVLPDIVNNLINDVYSNINMMVIDGISRQFISLDTLLLSSYTDTSIYLSTGGKDNNIDPIHLANNNVIEMKKVIENVKITNKDIDLSVYNQHKPYTTDDILLALREIYLYTHSQAQYWLRPSFLDHKSLLNPHYKYNYNDINAMNINTSLPISENTISSLLSTYLSIPSQPISIRKSTYQYVVTLHDAHPGIKYTLTLLAHLRKLGHPLLPKYFNTALQYCHSIHDLSTVIHIFEQYGTQYDIQSYNLVMGILLRQNSFKLLLPWFLKMQSSSDDIKTIIDQYNYSPASLHMTLFGRLERSINNLHQGSLTDRSHTLPLAQVAEQAKRIPQDISLINISDTIEKRYPNLSIPSPAQFTDSSFLPIKVHPEKSPSTYLSLLLPDRNMSRLLQNMIYNSHHTPDLLRLVVETITNCKVYDKFTYQVVPYSMQSIYTTNESNNDIPLLYRETIYGTRELFTIPYEGGIYNQRPSGISSTGWNKINHVNSWASNTMLDVLHGDPESIIRPRRNVYIQGSLLNRSMRYRSLNPLEQWECMIAHSSPYFINSYMRFALQVSPNPVLIYNTETGKNEIISGNQQEQTTIQVNNNNTSHTGEHTRPKRSLDGSYIVSSSQDQNNSDPLLVQLNQYSEQKRASTLRALAGFHSVQSTKSKKKKSTTETTSDNTSENTTTTTTNTSSLSVHPELSTTLHLDKQEAIHQIDEYFTEQSSMMRHLNSTIYDHDAASPTIIPLSVYARSIETNLHWLSHLGADPCRAHAIMALWQLQAGLTLGYDITPLLREQQTPEDIIEYAQSLVLPFHPTSIVDAAEAIGLNDVKYNSDIMEYNTLHTHIPFSYYTQCKSEYARTNHVSLDLHLATERLKEKRRKEISSSQQGDGADGGSEQQQHDNEYADLSLNTQTGLEYHLNTLVTAQDSAYTHPVYINLKSPLLHRLMREISRYIQTHQQSTKKAHQVDLQPMASPTLFDDEYILLTALSEHSDLGYSLRDDSKLANKALLQPVHFPQGYFDRFHNEKKDIMFAQLLQFYYNVAAVPLTSPDAVRDMTTITKELKEAYVPQYVTMNNAIHKSMLQYEKELQQQQQQQQIDIHESEQFSKEGIVEEQQSHDIDQSQFIQHQSEDNVTSNTDTTDTTTTTTTTTNTTTTITTASDDDPILVKLINKQQDINNASTLYVCKHHSILYSQLLEHLDDMINFVRVSNREHAVIQPHEYLHGQQIQYQNARKKY